MTLIGNTNTCFYQKSAREDYVDEIISSTNTDFDSIYAFFLDDLRAGRVDDEWEVEVLADNRIQYSFPKAQKLKKVARIYSDPNYQFCTVQINLFSFKEAATNPESKIYHVSMDQKRKILSGNIFFEDLTTRAGNKDVVLESIARGLKYVNDRDLALNDYKTTKSAASLQAESLEKENTSLKEQLATLSIQFKEMKEMMFAMNQNQAAPKAARKTK